MADDLYWETAGRARMSNGHEAYNAMQVPDRIIVAGWGWQISIVALFVVICFVMHKKLF